jgi:low affinity Fe/Cu permease
MVERPTQIGERRSSFDHFAERASEVVGQAGFFIGALLMVLVWIPTILVFDNADTWQLVISTITSVLAFLLVALLQNSQRRSDVALHRKLDALAEGLAVLTAADRAAGAGDCAEAQAERRQAEAELRAAVGLEERI